MGKSNISWTDETWNPTTGCSRVSEGCRNCYAEALSLRYGWSKKPWTYQNRVENVVLHPNRVELPLHWRNPRMVFVDSMSDLFHRRVPFNFIAQVFDVMADARASHHTFQLLTKRPQRMRTFFEWLAERWPGDSPANITLEVHGNLPNVWIGVSVEDQRRADERIPVLLEAPGSVRWVSVEPLLGPVTFRWAGWHHISRTRDTDHLDGLRDLDWIVCGGESGPGHRSMKIDWLESIVEQCQVAKVPVFVKQDSGSRPGKQGRIPDALWALKQYPKVAT